MDLRYGAALACMNGLRAGAAPSRIRVRAFPLRVNFRPGRDLMPTVAFDLFELDACGVSAAEMTTDVVQNNGVISDTVKTMRAITKRLLTSDCTSTTRRPAQAAVGRWWRWRTGRSGKAPKGPWWRPTAAPRSPPPSAFAIREIGVAAT